MEEVSLTILPPSSSSALIGGARDGLRLILLARLNATSAVMVFLLSSFANSYERGRGPCDSSAALFPSFLPSLIIQAEPQFYSPIFPSFSTRRVDWLGPLFSPLLPWSEGSRSAYAFFSRSSSKSDAPLSFFPSYLCVLKAGITIAWITPLLSPSAIAGMAYCRTSERKTQLRSSLLLFSYLRIPSVIAMMKRGSSLSSSFSSF